jgi:hypothetical protein
MTSPARLAANRKNAQKSTGPKTDEGKARSCRSALKHGLYANSRVVPRCEAVEFDRWLGQWFDQYRPQGPAETSALERAAHAAWKIRRCAEVEAATLEKRRRHARADFERVEVQRALKLGDDLMGLLIEPLKAIREDFPFGFTPPDPRAIFRELISFAQGVDWLIGGWRELLRVLEVETTWWDFDRLKAVRLMGKRCEDVLFDPEMTRLFLACYSKEERPWELWNIYENAGAVGQFRPGYQALTEALESQRPATREESRTLLRAIVHEQIEQLEQLKADELDELAELDAEEAMMRALFDDSPSGVALRRQESALERDLHRALNDLIRLQKIRGNEAIAKTPSREELTPDSPVKTSSPAGSGLVRETTARPREGRGLADEAPATRPCPGTAVGNEAIPEVFGNAIFMSRDPVDCRHAPSPRRVPMVDGAKDEAVDVMFQGRRTPG